jgi:ketosteroid isomerase-like protein
MVKGRPAIEAFWKQHMSSATIEKIMTLDVKPLGGNAAREIGIATLKKVQPPQDFVIKYAVVWQKEGGRWKLLQDIWNEDK